eukprot:3064593-Pyramimonas_sp.AAC.2
MLTRVLAAHYAAEVAVTSVLRNFQESTIGCTEKARRGSRFAEGTQGGQLQAAIEARPLCMASGRTEAPCRVSEHLW